MTNLFLIKLLIVSLLSVNTGKFNIQRIWLFKRIEYAGNIPVNPNGKTGANYTNKLICYLAITQNKVIPDWKEAYYNRQKYIAESITTIEDSDIVGKAKETGNRLMVKCVRGLAVRKLVFKLQGRYDGFKSDQFVLGGLINNKYVTLTTVQHAVELSPLFNE